MIPIPTWKVQRDPPEQSKLHVWWPRRGGWNWWVLLLDVSTIVEPQKWVFSIYDTSMKLGHIELVDDRSAATVIPLIQKYVLPGSTIHSDQWPAYNRLNQLGYNHLTVNHSQNVVDPNTGTCTNAIEAYWSRVKKKYPYTGYHDATNCLCTLMSFCGVTGCLTQETLKLIAIN